MSTQTQAQYIKMLKEEWAYKPHPLSDKVWEAGADATAEYIQAAQQVEIFFTGLGYLPVKKADILPLMEKAGRHMRFNLDMTFIGGKRRLRIDYAGRAAK